MIRVWSKSFFSSQVYGECFILEELSGLRFFLILTLLKFGNGGKESIYLTCLTNMDGENAENLY